MIRQVTAALLLGGALPCAVAAVTGPLGISTALRPTDNEQFAFVLNAHGAQIYACKPRADDSNAYKWTFIAPEATLLEDGKIVGYHGAGPVWGSMSDGSSVRGVVRERRVEGRPGGAGEIHRRLLLLQEHPPGVFLGPQRPLLNPGA